MAKAKVTPWPVAAEREVERLNERIDTLEAAARRARDLMTALTGYVGSSGLDAYGLTPEFDATYRDLTYAVYPHLKPGERTNPITEVVEVPPPPEVVEVNAELVMDDRR